MGDLFLSHEVAKGILQLHRLDEKVVLWIEVGSALRTLEIEGKPLLDSRHVCPHSEISEKDKVQDQRRGQNTISAEKIHFNMHGISQPTKNIDTIPSFLFVTTGRIVIDGHLVVAVSVKLRINLRLEYCVEH